MNLVALKAMTSVDDALDLIYAEVDDLGLAKRYIELDAILADPEVLTLPTDLLLGVLTISRRFDSHLAKRRALMQATHGVLIERGEDADVLLAYL